MDKEKEQAIREAVREWLASDYCDNFVTINQYTDGTLKIEFRGGLPYSALAERLGTALGIKHLEARAEPNEAGWEYVVQPQVYTKL